MQSFFINFSTTQMSDTWTTCSSSSRKSYALLPAWSEVTCFWRTRQSHHLETTLFSTREQNGAWSLILGCMRSAWSSTAQGQRERDCFAPHVRNEILQYNLFRSPAERAEWAEQNNEEAKRQGKHSRRYFLLPPFLSRHICDRHTKRNADMAQLSVGKSFGLPRQSKNSLVSVK